MADTIVFYPTNIAETSTSTVTMSGTADTGYPVTRLYDRSKNLMWRHTAPLEYIFKVDQGASDIKQVSIMWVASHNFDGVNIYWQYSDNNSDWTNASGSWLQSGNDDIIKTADASTHQYWRVNINDPVANATCGEIFMGLGYSFDIMEAPNPTHGYDDGNIEWSRSIGGQERGIKFGDRRERINYTLKLNATELTSFQAMIDELDDFSKPFIIKDKDGNYSLVRFDPIPSKNSVLTNLTEIDISTIEML